MDSEQNPSQAELSRLLVAADASLDPHLLVRLCCERCEGDSPSVSLILPADDGPAFRSAALLDAAGIRVDDVVPVVDDFRGLDRLVRSGGFDALLLCEAAADTASPVLPFAARLADLHGLTVLRSERPAGRASWLERAVHPFLHWGRT